MSESPSNSLSPSSRRRASIVGGLTGLLGFGVIQYRRSNRRAAMRALRDTVEPPGTPDPLTATNILPLDDAAHAPGHHHLSPSAAVEPSHRRLPWPRRADRTGHPGRFS